MESDLLQEVDVLQEIYIDELQIETNISGQATSITIKLYPATGEYSDQKWVCLTLQLQLPDDYPMSIPSILIRSPRGLTEEYVNCLKKSLTELAEVKKGTPLLYDLIEYARESLTTGNVLQGQCMICLEQLSASGKPVFTTTSCYHFFHWMCIYSYIEHCRREFEECRKERKSNVGGPAADDEVFEAVCPVCREPLPEEIVRSVDADDLKASIDSDEEHVKYLPSAEVVEMQRTMSELYQRQLERGGIIDLEAERNKYLIPKDGLMVPVNHSDDSLEVENMDSANVPEYKAGDEGLALSAEDASDSYDTKKYPVITSQVPPEKVTQRVSRISESAARRQASSYRRFADENCSIFFHSKRYLDRQRHDEQYRHRMDSRRQKLPSDAIIREHSPDVGLSDEVINGETSVSKLLQDTESRRSAGENENELLAESKGHTSIKCGTAGPAKPQMQSTRRHNGRRRYYVHGRNHHRSHGSYSHYDDDHDDDDDDDYVYDYVIQPKHYKDPRRNRQPKSVKTNGGVVSDDLGKKFDEEEANRSQSDGASCGAVVSSESVSAVMSSNKPNVFRLGDLPWQRRNNRHRIYGSTRDRQTSALDENDGAANPELQRPNNSADTHNNVEIKPGTQDCRPNRHWTSQPSDKTSRPKVNRNEELQELQKTTGVLSHLSLERSKNGEIQIEHEACTSVPSNHVKHRRPRKNWKRRGPDNATGRPPIDKDGELEATDSALSHLSVERSKGGDLQVEHDTVEVMKVTSTATEPSRVNDNHHPRKHWKRQASDKGSRSPVDKGELRTTGSASNLSVGMSKGADCQEEHGVSAELNRVNESRQSKKHWNRQPADKTSRLPADKTSRLPADKIEEIRAATDLSSCLSVGMSEGDDTQGERAVSAEPNRVKQATAQQTRTGNDGSQRVGSYRGRNNRTRQDIPRFSASRDDCRYREDLADGGLSRVEKESYWKNRGSRRRGAARDRESRPSGSQHSRDNPSGTLDELTDVPLTKPDLNVSGSQSHAS